MDAGIDREADQRMYLYFDAPHEPRHGDSTITTTPQAQAAFRKPGSLPLFAQLPS